MVQQLNLQKYYYESIIAQQSKTENVVYRSVLLHVVKKCGLAKSVLEIFK